MNFIFNGRVAVTPLVIQTAFIKQACMGYLSGRGFSSNNILVAAVNCTDVSISNLNCLLSTENTHIVNV